MPKPSTVTTAPLLGPNKFPRRSVMTSGPDGAKARRADRELLGAACMKSEPEMPEMPAMSAMPGG